MAGALKPADFHILLALTQGPRHGYGLMKEVERESRGGLRLEVGSLYRLLARLLESGLIEEADEDERRRYYRISRLGRRSSRAKRSALPAWSNCPVRENYCRRPRLMRRLIAALLLLFPAGFRRKFGVVLLRRRQTETRTSPRENSDRRIRSRPACRVQNTDIRASGASRRTGDRCVCPS
jgi:DNA-binding PadR family transcriptional regulator